MSCTLAVWKLDTPNRFQKGDVVDIFPGEPAFKGERLRQSGEWRLVIVMDADARQLAGLCQTYMHNNELLLHRMIGLDIDGLEAHAEKMAGRKIAADDMIRTGKLQIETFTKRKLLPFNPVVLN